MFAPNIIRRRLNICLSLCFFIFLFYNIFVLFNLRTINEKISTAKECFELKPNITNINFFEDLTDSEKQPVADRTIFFHETSCSTNGIVSLNAR